MMWYDLACNQTHATALGPSCSRLLHPHPIIAFALTHPSFTSLCTSQVPFIIYLTAVLHRVPSGLPWHRFCKPAFAAWRACPRRWQHSRDSLVLEAGTRTKAIAVHGMQVRTIRSKESGGASGAATEVSGSKAEIAALPETALTFSETEPEDLDAVES